jgi:hypothetical protein
MTRASSPVPSDPQVRIRSHATDTQGLLMRLDHGLLSVVPYTARTVRIRYTLADELSHKPSLTVSLDRSAAAPVPFCVEEQAASLIMRTGELTVEIDRATAALTYRDAAGGLLTREPSRGGKTIEPIDVLASEFDTSMAVADVQHVDGLRMETMGVRQVFDRRAYHTKVEFEWTNDEALYGLGSHEEGMFNLRGRHQYLYQHNTKVAVPVLVSSHGYGVFFDCASLMTFHDDESGSYVWSDVEEELDYYFMVGPEFDDIVGEIRLLSGQAPMLPRWAFGFIQSKERYATQEELLAVAREYRARRLPLDCIVLDWQSWTGDLWGQKSLDPERFPDPRRMTKELHDLDVRLMVSIWPAMRPGGADWQEFSEAGLLLGNGATYDAFDSRARALYWRQAERGLFSYGIDAWWTDCTEPFEADWTGPAKPDPEERLRINTAEAKRYLDPETINAYSLVHAEGLYRGQRATGSSKRMLNLTRSAFVGQQRFGTVTWSGDVTATWETLRRQIAEGLNFCVTGMPFWTTDVGGFFVARRPDAWFWAGDFDAGVDDLGYGSSMGRGCPCSALMAPTRRGSCGASVSRASRRTTRSWGHSSCGTAYSRISIRLQGGPPSARTRCCAPWPSTSALTRRCTTSPTSSCSGPHSWSVPSTGRWPMGPVRVRSRTYPDGEQSISRPEATGTTSGPTIASMAAPGWRRTLRSSGSRRSCERARSCPWVRFVNTRGTGPMRHSRSTSMPGTMVPSRCTRTRVTGTGTRTVRSRRSRSGGRTPLGG